MPAEDCAEEITTVRSTNVLLVYPQTPVTFWSMQHAVEFIGKRSGEPPLELITVAAMLPEDWNRRMVDTNVTDLTDDDVRWADLVFLSGMDLIEAVNLLQRKNATPRLWFIRGIVGYRVCSFP